MVSVRFSLPRVQLFVGVYRSLASSPRGPSLSVSLAFAVTSYPSPPSLPRAAVVNRRDEEVRR